MEPSLPFALRLKQERLKRGWSQAELASKLGCDTKTIQRWENGNLPQPYYRQRLSEIFALSLEDFALAGQFVHGDPVAILAPQEQRADLDEAPDLLSFFGREAECAQLKSWITEDRCRLVTILGVGGVGKTTLAARVVELVHHNFTSVLWRSLKNAPSLATVLRQCLHFLNPLSYSELPADIEEQTMLLIDALQRERCLLILDNVEAILQPQQRAGLYLPGYENYAWFLQHVGQARHQSCILLTSREKPSGLSQMEGPNALIRSLHLGGITSSDGQELLKEKSLLGEEAQWIELNGRYGGNPLALKLVSELIREIFAGQIGEFLQEQSFVLGDINDLLQQQFGRLSPQECELIVWLAIERETVSLMTLRSNPLRSSADAPSLDALASLSHRSLIETIKYAEPKRQPHFFLQPVILEYATTQLVRRSCDEFMTHALSGADSLYIPETWQRFAFLQATALDYTREIQQRMILGPICNFLLDHYGQTDLENHLVRLLTKARRIRLPNEYLAGNVLNILLYLRGSNASHAFPELCGFDFADLTIRQAYLQNVHLPATTFSGSSFQDTVFTNAFGAVTFVTFSRDGSLLAAGTAIGEIWLYDVASGVPRSILRGHRDGVWALAFDTDSMILASGSDDRTVRLWDLASGQCTLLLTEHTDRVRAVAFSPDGTYLVSGSNDQRICVWKTGSGHLLKTLRGHLGAIWSLAFHASGHLLASAGMDHTIRLWNMEALLEDEALLHTFAEHTDGVRAVAFHRDTNILASGSDDQTVRLWDIQEFQCLSVLRGHTNRVWSVAFKADDSMVVSSGEDGTIRFWHSATGECTRILQAHHRGVRSIAFSPDGKLLASGGEDQAFRLWESQTGKSLKIVQGYINRILSINFTPAGQLISADDNQEIRLWNVSSGQCLNILSTRDQGTRTITISPDGKLLASVGGDQQVHLWNLENGLHLDTLPYHTNWGRTVSFSPDGELLASGGEDRMVILWHVKSRQKMQILRAHQSWLRALAFSKDSTLLASGGDDRVICLWDVKTGVCVKKLEGHRQAVRALAFHPIQKLLFSGAEDWTIRCWNTETGECLYVLEGHTDRVLSIDMHQAGTHLASGGDDLSLRIWKLDDCSCQIIPNAHMRRIRALAYAPDGGLLASCSDDGTIGIWDTTSGQYLKTLIGDRPYEGMNIARVIGLTESQRVTLHTLGAREDR